MSPFGVLFARCLLISIFLSALQAFVCEKQIVMVNLTWNTELIIENVHAFLQYIPEGLI